MPTTTIRRRRGPLPQPRRKVNPQLLAAVYEAKRPLWWLAVQSGFSYPTVFSKLIHSEEVPDTEFNVTALERIAEVVGFDKTQLFLDGDR